MKILQSWCKWMVAGCLLLSCNTYLFASTFTIKGRIHNIKSGTVFLEQYYFCPTREVAKKELNSDGMFEIKGDISEIGFYRLRFQSYEYAGISIQTINLVLDTGTCIDFTASAPELEISYTIEGSKDSDLLRQINQELKKSYYKRDSLERLFMELRKDSSTPMDSLTHAFKLRYELLQDETEQFVRDLVLTDPSSITMLVIINNLDKEKDADAYQLIDRNLSNRFPDIQKVKEFHKGVTDQLRLMPGSPAPDFELNDYLGREVILSAYKGKVVLLTFASSNNWPARQEFPDLARLKKKYKKSGIEIVTFFIERDKPEWVRCIEIENANWHCVSDLLYWDSPMLKLYEIKSIPYYWLINQNGIIVKKSKSIKELKKNIEVLFPQEKEK